MYVYAWRESIDRLYTQMKGLGGEKHIDQVEKNPEMGVGGVGIAPVQAQSHWDK